MNFSRTTKRQLNWFGSLFMRFGASCCPSWDPSNWLSRKVPTLLSALWMSRSQNENQKLLRRSASEEEMFQKKPKRKNTKSELNIRHKNSNSKHQKSESENNLSAVTATTVTTVEIVTEGQPQIQKLSTSKADKEMKTISKIGKVMKSKQNKNSVESASSSSTTSVASSRVSSEAISLNPRSKQTAENPRRRRSRREQAVLAAKSSRGGGGRGSYTAANLRRYAAEHKPSSSMKHADYYMLEKRSQSANALKFSPFNAGTIRLFRCIIWLCLFTYLFY